jgi:hypothetical protein
MKPFSFEAIVSALNEAGVRYLVVGGIAVDAHGYLRVTNDVNIVIRLERSDIVTAFASLAPIGYFPSVPVTAEEFADPALRESWRREKGMLVLKMWSDAHRKTPSMCLSITRLILTWSMAARWSATTRWLDSRASRR